MKKIALPIRVEDGPAGSKCLVSKDAELILSTQDATDGELAELVNLVNREHTASNQVGLVLTDAHEQGMKAHLVHGKVSKEAIILLRQVERWMSGYGTTTQPEMQERIRAYLAANNLQDFE